MNNQKGFAPIIIVLIVVALFAGGILAWQYWWIPSQQSPSIEDKTANWKIYRNEEYGYEVRYPKDWEIFLFGEPVVSAEGNFVVDIAPQGFKTQTGLLVAPISIKVWKENLSRFLKLQGFREIKEILINNIPAKEVKGEYYDAPFHGIYIEKPDIDGFIEINNGIDNYEKAGRISSQEAEKLRKVFNQMLSTFKFLE